MAIRITPGYDFRPDEKPSRDTLRLAAAGVSISGIPAAKLETTLLRVTINDSSSASNLPQDGALWVDAKGNLWGRNTWGNVQVRRSLGGWESNRLFTRGNTPALIGRAHKLVVGVAGGTNVSETQLEVATDDGYNGAQPHVAVNQETAVSSATHQRFCFRGLTRMHCPDGGPTFVWERGALFMRAAFSSNWNLSQMDGAYGQNYQAQAGMRDAESGNTDVLGYFYGLLIKSP